MKRAGVLFLVCVAGCFAILGQAAELRAMRGQLEAAEARAAAYAEAAQKAARVVAQLEGQAQDAAALDRSLQEGEGADAPLSDYLRAGAGRVWQ